MLFIECYIYVQLLGVSLVSVITYLLFFFCYLAVLKGTHYFYMGISTGRNVMCGPYLHNFIVYLFLLMSKGD